jgi:voltage-gated potassium channel
LLALALVTTLVTVYAFAVTSYAVCDDKGAGDALWWGLMTFTTVGYGDQYPTSALGRVGGIALVIVAVFIVLPTMTALIASRLIHDEHEWTHDEQEELKTLVRDIHRKVCE